MLAVLAFAFREVSAKAVPGKSALLAFETQAFSKNNEPERQHTSNDVNEFSEANGFPVKRREKRWGYYWHETRPKKKFRPSPLIWG